MTIATNSAGTRREQVSFELARSELEALSMGQLQAVFCTLSTLESVICAMTNAPWFAGEQPLTVNAAGAILDRLYQVTCSMISLAGDVAAHARLKDDDAEAAETRAYILLKREADLGGDDFGSTALMAVEQMHAISMASDKASGARIKRCAA